MAKKILKKKKVVAPPPPVSTGPIFLVYTQSRDTTEPKQWFQAYGPDNKPIHLQGEMENAKAIIANMAKTGSKLRWRLVKMVAEF